MTRLALTFVLALPLCGKWWKLESGPITVITDGAERSGRDALAKLDLARRVFSGLGSTSAPLPVEAFALTSEARFRALRPSEAVQGFYQSSAERDYIVLNMASSDPSRVAFHEYVHLVLNHTTGPLPPWLEEGLAEFHSTLESAAGKVRLGNPIGNHLRILSIRPWLSGDEIAGVTKQSPHFDEASRAGIFYAQSWALVHMLRLHEQYRDAFPAFLSAVAAGVPQVAALQRAFGKSFPELIVDLKHYLDRSALPVVDYAVELGNQAGIVSTELSDLDADLAYAGLANQCGRPEEAGKVYRKYRGAKPDSARMATALGMMELAARRGDSARNYFEQAIQFPDAGAETYFEYAMLLRDTGGSPSDTLRFLEKAVERNPRHAEAQFLLGVAYASQSKHAEAVLHIEQAAAVLPRQSYFWHALATCYQALGRKQEAVRAARRALDAAATVEQAEMARAAIQSLEVQPAAALPKRPAVTTPESWKNKQGDARLQGILERIECLGQSARFHVRAQNKTHALLVENPGDVLLKNFSSATFEFRCGPQKPLPIVLDYFSNTGIVSGIEFP
ncbi:MAG: DUF1570 domain-containing protein [Bryobacteraceae bacterium]